MTLDRRDQPLLDPLVLRELEALGADLGEDVLGEVIAAFERTAPALVAELSRAWWAGDRSAMARAAHTLRSASLQVGATRLNELARAIESEALGDVSDLAERVEVCTRELETVRAELARMVGKST